MNIIYTRLRKNSFELYHIHKRVRELRERERERERESVRAIERKKSRGRWKEMHLASCPKFELKIVNDIHGIYRAQNDHNFRDISRKHDTCLDNLRWQMHVSHYFLSCAAYNG